MVLNRSLSSCRSQPWPFSSPVAPHRGTTRRRRPRPSTTTSTRNKTRRRIVDRAPAVEATSATARDRLPARNLPGTKRVVQVDAVGCDQHDRSVLCSDRRLQRETEREHQQTGQPASAANRMLLMGIAHRCELPLRCIFVVWDGDVTPDQWTAHFKRLVNDPGFAACSRALVDLSTAGGRVEHHRRCDQGDGGTLA